MSLVKLIFENPRYNFFTSISDMSNEEIKEDLIGSEFNFWFKEGGFETCINIEYDQD